MDNDTTVSAVSGGTDLRRYARVLHGTHEAMLTGGKPPVAPRDLVTRSWTRMQRQGMNPDRWRPGMPVGLDELEQHRQATGLVTVLDTLRGSLAAVAADTDQLVVITNAEGIVLWRQGCTQARLRADRIGFTDGAHWTEAAVGTNAIGTALAEGMPVQLFSAEHYARNLHSWTCTASPIHDPGTGRLLGIIDISGHAASAHPVLVALVRTAARLAESELWRQHELQLQKLRTVASSILANVSPPAVVVDDDGWVAAAHGLEPVARIAAPELGRPCAVSGVGMCLPEQISGGWLLRPDTARTLCLRLDLDSTPACAVVEGSTVWRYPLTTRHVEILALLMRAGGTGLDASALSRMLYGNRHHEVTVRAELSRLRRKLGGLLLTRPYRIAPNIKTDV